VELKKSLMIKYILKSNIRFILYMIKKYGLTALYRGIKETSDVGAAMPNIGTKTMDKRRVNPLKIDRKEKRELLKKILPYWKKRNVAVVLQKRLIEERVASGDIEGFLAALPSTTSKKDTYISSCAAMGTWQGHLVIDFETPVKRGILAMREDVLKKMRDEKNLTEDEKDFLRSQEIVYDSVVTFVERLNERIREEIEGETDNERRAILTNMLKNSMAAPLYPAATFEEAVQAYWTVKCVVDLAVPFNAQAPPGRLDQYMYPLYKKDVEEGRITRDAARELLEELLLKVMTHNMRPDSNYNGTFGQRYEGSEPVTLGGLTRDGVDGTNELTYLVLEAAERSKTALNIVVRLHDGSPDELMKTVSGLHYRGTSSISLMNDNVSIKALMKRGFTEEDAKDYAVCGCVDMCTPGKTGGIGFSAILLARVLDVTLRNGDSKTLIGTIEDVGLKTGDPDTFTSFDQFVDAFTAQGGNIIKQIVDATTVRDRLYAEELPVPYISAFMQGCLDKKKDVTKSGAVYDMEGILFMNSIANVVDSLFVIKKLIFEKKAFTFATLLDAIDHNYKGYEDIHRMIMEVEGKWGNGNAESDGLAREVTSRLFEETYKYRTYKGGPYAPFINSMTAHTFDGRLSTATPDGRMAAMPYAASCNPYNVDKNGITGVLKSVAALDFTDVLGCAVNVRLHPSAIGETAETRRKYISLLKTYFRLGGEQVQPTVASTEMLQAAQDNPEEYRGLIVKVGGYSAYFVDLGEEIQNEIISRSEHRM